MKRVKISQLKLQLHQKVMELTDRDAVDSKIPPDISILSENQVSTLLENIVLNVVVSTDGEYQLLAPNEIYELLVLHPAAKNMSVYLVIHTPLNESELIDIIDTLNLIRPALYRLKLASKSKTINARYRQFRTMGYKRSTLALLSQLANASRSTFRG